MTETNENSVNGANGANGATTEKKAEVDDALNAKILRQVEFYFGDFNLPRDKFLLEKVKEEEGGWISMETMLNFKRLSALSEDTETILKALKGSELVEVNEEKKMIRRLPDLSVPEFDEERKKEIQNQTVYCKGINKDHSLDDVLPFFEKFGPIWNVQMRTYLDKTDNGRKFKGSVFVTFKSKEEAEKFLKLEKVEYKDTELIRKWQEEYFEEKKNEAEEKKKERENSKKEKLEKKKERQKEQNEEEDKKEAKEESERINNLPTGAVLHLTGIGNETMREDIKSKLEEDYKVDLADIAFIYFQKGDSEAKLRFKTENAAKEVFEKLPADGLEIKGAKTKAAVLEGEEEKAFLEQCLDDMEKNKNNKNRGHKRKSGFRGGYRGGRGGKRPRH